MEQHGLSKLRLHINNATTPVYALLPKGLVLLALIALAGIPCASHAKSEDAELNPEHVTVINNARQGIDMLLRYIKQRPELFPRKTPQLKHVLSAEDRQEVRDIWARFLDYQLSLDTVDQQLDGWETGKQNAAFALGYASFLARYRYAMDFIELIDKDPAVRIALNEAIPALGIPERSYADFKFHYLNIAIASQFAALSALNKVIAPHSQSAIASSTQEDERQIWKAGRGKGLQETASNAVQVTKHVFFTTVFPVQKNTSEWMGDTRVLKGENYYVSPQQVEDIAGELMPGDILLQRREWFLSNLGLPGFWSHAALYVGTPEERAAYFDDAEVIDWTDNMDGNISDLDALLHADYPEAYRISLDADTHGHPPRVVEAISEGVVFTSREHLATTDSLAILRPRLSKLEKAKALLKAFAYSGRPYDFNFDFRSDTQLVCTELVYKAYEPEQGKRGLHFPVHTVAGRPVITANDIATQFDRNFGTPRQQLDLVLFLDGNEREGRAKQGDVDTFRASWRRPKWYILIQNTPLASR